MKKIFVLFIGILVLVSFGCVKNEAPDQFQVLDIRILGAEEASDGKNIYILLQPYYLYANPVKLVEADEDWIINGVPVHVRDYHSLLHDKTKLNGDLIKTWDKSSLLWKVPKGTTEVHVTVLVTAEYPSGGIASQSEQKNLPVVL